MCKQSDTRERQPYVEDALTGFSKEFEHFDGHKVKVERGGITIPGQVETLAKEGMPIYNAHKKFGNLVITYQVKFPKALNENQKAQVKTLFAGTF
jgi:DnaJ-class molecular chaperone